MTAALGSYRLLERIGEGSTAVVHRAVDPYGRTVAVKEPRRSRGPAGEVDEAVRRRLAREMAVLAKIRSPYVVTLLDGDVAGTRPYVVTQYVAGVPLREFVGTYGPLRDAALHRFAQRLAAALAAVHGAGVVHRDLTPANIMVVGGSPVVVDFGIAHEATAARTTRPGMLVGTPAYLAPELVEGERATAASDVFAWAATLAYAATGRPPFGAGSLHGFCYRILRGAADLGDMPEPLRSLAGLGLRRDPAARPAASWFAAALGAWYGAPGAPAPAAVAG
jgi:serine/threonine protein kinase